MIACAIVATQIERARRQESKTSAWPGLGDFPAQKSAAHQDLQLMSEGCGPHASEQLIDPKWFG
jgi:hypothetical protein